MKILFISTHHGTGASESLWIEAAEYLFSQGHQVSALVNWRNPNPERLRPLKRHGIEVRYLNISAQSGNLASIVRRLVPTGFLEYARTRSAIDRLRPDAVVFSEGNDISALPFMEIAIKMGVPFQIVTHGLNPAEWPADNVADRLRTAFTSAAHTFWVAMRNIEEFEFHIGTRLPRASIARNPVKVPRSTPFSWPDSESPLRLACVARMQARPKGHDLLLQALAHQRWQDRPLHLSFFGEGENRRGMKRLSKMLNLTGRVHFRDHVESVADIWCDHHLIAQPSRNEGMPLSLVEALMFGRPALATDVAGHTELIEDGVNGFIAEAATVRHIDAALERLWTHRHALPEMARNAYERIRRDVPPAPVHEFAEQIIAATMA